MAILRFNGNPAVLGLRANIGVRCYDATSDPVTPTVYVKSTTANTGWLLASLVFLEEEGGAGGGDHATEHEPGGGDTLAVNAAAGVGSLRTLSTTATSACAGNDARLSDSRAPTSHASTHNAGGGDALAIDAAAGTGSLRTIGTGALTACAGNDSRLSDQRAPTDGDKGDITVTASGATWTIDAGAVTLAKQANLAADTLQGRGNGGGTGVPQAITLGTNLSMAGTVLNAAGGAGGDLSMTKKAPAANVTVTAGYSCYVADEYQLVSGVETEIGLGATLEIG